MKSLVSLFLLLLICGGCVTTRTDSHVPELLPRYSSEEYATLDRRWNAGVPISLSASEASGLSRMIFPKMDGKNCTLGDVKAVDGGEFLVDAFYYDGPDAAAHYRFVVKKRRAGWSYVRHYVLSIA